MDEAEFEQELTTLGLSSNQASKKARLFVKSTMWLRAMGVSSDKLHYYFVPGRIEFLGKHTDYAGGRSLICTVERGFCVVASPREDSSVRLTDAARQDHVAFNLTSALVPRAGHWSNYAMTVANRIARDFPAGCKPPASDSSKASLRGADIAFISDLPSAAGLSSSSALVVAIFSILARFNELDQRLAYKTNIHTMEDLAGYLGAVENGQRFGSLAGSRGVGTLGGSQDQTAILCCRPGRLSQYSFCPVSLERSIPLPDDYVFVIGVSGVSAEKTGDALDKYNRVSLRTAEILAIWRGVTGRADDTLLAGATSSPGAPERIREMLRKPRSSAFSAQELVNRFDQFFIECTQIIPAVSHALAEGDVDKIGTLIDSSQDGAERLLGNQVPETILLARLARELGSAAATAFGAGFGGSVWALIKNNDVDRFISEWAERYRVRFPASTGRSTFFSTCAGPPMIRFSESSNSNQS